jgi:hypothetical protein
VPVLLLALGSASAAGLLARKEPVNICASFSKEDCVKYHFFDGTMTTRACMLNQKSQCVMSKGCLRKELEEPCTTSTIKIVEQGDDVKVEAEKRCDHCDSVSGTKNHEREEEQPKAFAPTAEDAHEFKPGQKLPIQVLPGGTPLDDFVVSATQGLDGDGKPKGTSGPRMGPTAAAAFKKNSEMLHPVRWPL